MLFLVVLTLRDIIRQRRLNFLFYILNQETDSMIYKVFQSQCKHQTSKDWVTTVKADIQYLGLNVKFEDIKQTSKAKWKATINKRVTEKSLERLNSLKMKHSKVNDLKHTGVKMQSYLLPNEVFATKDEI